MLLTVSCTREPVETTCTLYGVVMSSSTDDPIKGVLVTVNPVGQQVISGTDGTFEIEIASLDDQNSYLIFAQKKGYYTNAVSVQSVHPGERRYVPIILEPIE